MANNIDLTTHLDFVMLQSLQLSQVKEMGELRSAMNNNFMQISKQLAELGKNSYSTETGEIPKIPPDLANGECSDLVSLP